MEVGQGPGPTGSDSLPSAKVGIEQQRQAGCRPGSQAGHGDRAPRLRPSNWSRSTAPSLPASPKPISTSTALGRAMKTRATTVCRPGRRRTVAPPRRRPADRPSAALRARTARRRIGRGVITDCRAAAEGGDQQAAALPLAAGDDVDGLAHVVGPATAAPGRRAPCRRNAKATTSPRHDQHSEIAGGPGQHDQQLAARWRADAPRGRLDRREGGHVRRVPGAGAGCSR